MGIAFDRIQAGLNDATAHASGRANAAKVYTPTPVDIAALRERLAMSQPEFAARFGFSVATLRHWERGDRAPTGAARVLLNVIERAPKAVLQALR